MKPILLSILISAASSSITASIILYKFDQDHIMIRMDRDTIKTYGDKNEHK